MTTRLSSVSNAAVTSTFGVELSADHPGVADPAYRRRRDEIAAAANGLCPFSEARRIDYTAAENRTWAAAANALSGLHDVYACRAFLNGAARLGLPTDHVPQLADVSARLHELTGWHIDAAPGLAPTRDFYGALAERRFLSTQYVRHGSVPLYTPEPDIIHEVIGHANMLADPRFAALYATAGAASRRCDDQQLQRFSKTFWFTLEFGVVHEDGELKAYGAGLLSSFGEVQAFRDAEIRDWDPDAMSVTDYDIDQYQPVLFAAPDFDAMVGDLTDWFDAIAR